MKMWIILSVGSDCLAQFDAPVSDSYLMNICGKALSLHIHICNLFFNMHLYVICQDH